MNKPLDEMLSDFLKSEPVAKAAIPPKLYHKMRYWLERNKSARIKHAGAQKSEDIEQLQSLAKNEAQISAYQNGLFKLDFGSDVSESVRKAALSWAKRRGLKVLEAPLTKSADQTQTYVFGVTDSQETGECVKRQKWSF